MQTLDIDAYKDKVAFILQSIKGTRETIVLLVKDGVHTYHTSDKLGIEKLSILVDALLEGNLSKEVDAIGRIIKGSTALEIRISDDLSKAYVAAFNKEPDSALWQANMLSLDYDKFMAYMPNAKSKGAKRRFANEVADKKKAVDSDLAKTMVAFEDPVLQTAFEKVATAAANMAGDSAENVKKVLEATEQALNGGTEMPLLEVSNGYKWNNPAIADKLQETTQYLQQLDSADSEVSKSKHKKTASHKADCVLSELNRTLVATLSTFTSLAKFVPLRRVG